VVVLTKSYHSVPSLTTKIVTPSYENPQWRFLQGRGELLANSDTGGAFNIFEAAEFPDKDFPLYIYGRLYSKKDIIIEIAKIIVYQSYNLSSNQGKLHGTLKSNNTGKCRIPFINLILINVMPKREQFLITLNVLTMQYI
jgi:hypothetical protein